MKVTLTKGELEALFFAFAVVNPEEHLTDTPAAMKKFKANYQSAKKKIKEALKKSKG